MFQEVKTAWSQAAQIRLILMRDDLSHNLAQGNKIRKLQSVFQRLSSNHIQGVLTFGGAFSNHLYAVAALCNSIGKPSVGIVRGTWADPNNHTLAAVQEMGMQLHYVSAEAFRNAGTHTQVREVLEQYPTFEILPEGGTTPDAIRACMSYGADIMAWAETYGTRSTTHVFVSMGTGGTAAGLLAGLHGDYKVHIIGPTQQGITPERIAAHLAHAALETDLEYHVYTEYALGGFGRRNTKLDAFISAFQAETGILCDPVYTCKTFLAAKDMAERGCFAPNDTVLLIHTGGMQGWGAAQSLFE